MKFNTSIAQLMILINELYKYEKISKEVIEKFILILSPFTPHISEELWEKLGNKSSVQNNPWPQYDEELAKADMVTIAFSVNGKVRSKMEMDYDSDEKTLEQAALDDKKIKKYIFGKEILRIIVVKNRMVNVVAK
jgi:leucyl-tRNA synthetase